MMKKFLTVLVLGLAIFAVSCGDDDSKLSTDETTFVEKVASTGYVLGTGTGTGDKTYANGELMFSSDGKKITITYDVSGEATTKDFSFTVGDSDNTASVGVYGGAKVEIATFSKVTIDSIEYTFGNKLITLARVQAAIAAIEAASNTELGFSSSGDASAVKSAAETKIDAFDEVNDYGMESTVTASLTGGSTLTNNDTVLVVLAPASGYAFTSEVDTTTTDEEDDRTTLIVTGL